MTDEEVKSIPFEQLARVFPNLREPKLRPPLTAEQVMQMWCLRVFKALCK